jgi:hypothetical protein
MGQILHGSATTTEAVRRAIQHSQESLRGLAKRFHVSFLWPGAGLARVERFARRRVSLSQGSAIACDRPSSPRSDRPLSGC